MSGTETVRRRATIMEGDRHEFLQADGSWGGCGGPRYCRECGREAQGSPLPMATPATIAAQMLLASQQREDLTDANAGIEVIQADRQRMVLYENGRGIPLHSDFARAILAGEHDDDRRVQAFARHRLAFTPPAGQVAEGMSRAGREDWILVPREPTDAMAQAVIDQTWLGEIPVEITWEGVAEVLRVMIAATPSADGEAGK